MTDHLGVFGKRFSPVLQFVDCDIVWKMLDLSLY